MSEYNNILEYDKEGRIIRQQMMEPQMNIFYEHKNNLRICTSTSSFNNTNHLEIVTQKKIKDGYIDTKTHQEGRIYNITTEYDDNGKEIFVTRLNKVTNSIYRKKIIRDSSGAEKIWLEVYNKEENIGFKVDMEKILKKIDK
tara:strand:- start:433 stop:858 length:426 start_codon:yes stop_codon:yes gene_type:complete